MFSANNINKDRIMIENADKNVAYFCPVCEKEVIIKASDSLAVRTHFAHKRGSKCLDNWKHDMSEWHYQWQLKFPKECREVVIEKDDTKHRADICIGNNVIEFQHSPISKEEILERSIFYTDCGYHLVWVFDATGKIMNGYYNETIDPFRCRSDELCWKRSKREFDGLRLPRNTSVFLQYKTKISDKRFSPDTVFDTMIILSKIDSKYFSFLRTLDRHGKYYYYITPGNFLKEYGCIDNNDALSISDILARIR